MDLGLSIIFRSAGTIAGGTESYKGRFFQNLITQPLGILKILFPAVFQTRSIGVVQLGG